ncbi:MAG TPA: prepilin-type N-terminal cleavage/methylation domain-containing protein [Vicinamibacterales bacterium]|nr:prepilin-type N-terminal cleavage/methylation domain-containing protein [Vicinamibacterales bacterium]
MRKDHGFSLTEALIATAVLLLLFSAAMPALNQTMMFNRTVGDLSEMHGSVRGATELMQQEIGQAGRVALPGPITLANGAAKGATTVALSTTAGLFVGAHILVGTGDQGETVTVTAINPPSVTAVFGIDHAASEPVQLLGGFVTGVIPPTMTNGSTGTALKLYGDINDDGQMVYVEYTCNLVNKKLYRNVMAWDAASKPAVTESMALLNNVVANPNNAPCFTYETQVVLNNTYVTGVAVTLSVESQQVDLYSKQKNQATKTLLNVSPRNIFLAWSMASIGITNRLQPTPPSILLLLP